MGMDLSIEKTDGIGEKLYWEYIVLNSSGENIYSQKGEINVKAGTPITYTVDPSVLSHGSYKIKLTIKDNSGYTRSETETTFVRISGTGITCAIQNTSGGTDLTYTAGTVKFIIGVKKTDGVQETLTATVEIKNSAGKVIYTTVHTYEDITSSYNLWNVSIGSAPAGSFTLVFTLKDDTDRTRVSYSKPLTVK